MVGLQQTGAPRRSRFAYAGAQTTLRGFRLRETPTVEKLAGHRPLFLAGQTSKENSHVHIQRKTR